MNDTQYPSEGSENISKDVPNLDWLERITRLLDSKFKLPGLSTRFGLDPILGLVPFAGDIVTLIMSAIMVVVMARHGASGILVMRMVGNIIVDYAIGSVPFVGDIADFRIRANRKNYELLREHYYDNEHRGSGKGVILGLILMLLVLLTLTIYAVIKLVGWLIGLL